MRVRPRLKLALLAAALLAFGRPPCAQAQATSSPAPAASPAPKPPLFRFGYGMLGLDAEMAPSVLSEFHTAPNATNTTISYWGLGDFILWKFRIFGATDYRAYSYQHVQSLPGNVCPNAAEPGCVTVVGPVFGQVNVAGFNARESELERTGGLEVGLGFYLAGAIFQKTNNYGYSALNGFGYGIGRAPRPAEPISPYFSFYYYPNVGGNVATSSGKIGFSYRGAHYRAGSLFQIGPTRFYVDAGLIGSRFTSRASAPSDAFDSAGYAGLGYRI